MLLLLTMGIFKVNYCSYPFIPTSGAVLSASAFPPPPTLLSIHIVVLVWMYLVATNGQATQAPALL